jgi:hypothetical protein
VNQLAKRLALRVWARLEGFPVEWYDRGRLVDWERAHADPAGDVWATSWGGDAWYLYPPGSPKDGPYPYEGVAEADRCADWNGDEERSRGEDLPWAQAWVERVSGRRVVDAVNGFAWYGPDHAASDYIIYVRVAS